MWRFNVNFWSMVLYRWFHCLHGRSPGQLSISCGATEYQIIIISSLGMRIKYYIHLFEYWLLSCVVYLLCENSLSPSILFSGVTDCSWQLKAAARPIQTHSDPSRQQTAARQRASTAAEQAYCRANTVVIADCWLEARLGCDSTCGEQRESRPFIPSRALHEG